MDSKQPTPVRVIRIEVYNHETNEVLSSVVTDTAIFAVVNGTNQDISNQQVLHTMVGKPAEIVNVFNYQVNAMSMGLGLRAIVQGGIPAPYFVLPTKEKV